LAASEPSLRLVQVAAADGGTLARSFTSAMNLLEFQASLSLDEPPRDLPPLLRALWHDAKGDWDAAHHVAQDVESSDGSWVHAYLHRKEGDVGNAAYWYRRAGKPIADDALDEEWARIAQELLST
jgi:hypothetical protein